MDRETSRSKDDEAQGHDQGIRERCGWCSSRRVRRGSSLRVLGGGWVKMNSHDVEISIAGGVRKLVHGRLPGCFFFFFFLFFFY